MMCAVTCNHALSNRADPGRHRALLQAGHHALYATIGFTTCRACSSAGSRWAIVTRLDPTAPTLRALVTIGKTSLFVYVVQYAFVQALPYQLGWKGEMPPWRIGAPCVVALAVDAIAGRLWNTHVKHA